MTFNANTYYASSEKNSTQMVNIVMNHGNQIKQIVKSNTNNMIFLEMVYMAQK